MNPQTVQPIAVENLLLYVLNPRYIPQHSQRDALQILVHDQDLKLVRLAEDIARKGLNPSDLPIVAPTDDAGIFTVLEGNRRIAAIKLASSPDLLASLDIRPNIVKRFKAIHEMSTSNIPDVVVCAVSSPEDANHWISLKHTGENDGVGVVRWDGPQTDRFRGSSPALQAIDLVDKGPFIEDSIRQELPQISYTNVQRILDSPDARAALGINIEKDKTVVLNHMNSLAWLSKIVTDVVKGDIDVTQIYKKPQLLNYVQSVVSGPIPQPIGGPRTSAGSASTSPQSGASAKSKRTTKGERKTLIPRQLKLNIQQPRINKMYNELQALEVEKFTNSAAVMLRVFVELSIDHYAGKNGIDLTKAPSPTSTSKKRDDMTLRQKLTAVADYLEANAVCTKGELVGIRSLISNRHHILSIDVLNAYVHNKDYSPTPGDLKTNWDNIQIFVERLWS